MSNPRESRNPEPADRQYLYRVLATVAIFMALTLALLALRFYRLNELPPGIQSDEGPDGVFALQVLQGRHSVFFPEKGSGRGAVGVYAVALSTMLLGRTLLSFHLPTAVASAGTVFAVFWLGSLLFGRDEESGRAAPRRGLMIGAVGAGLMAVSVSQTFLARAGLRANYLLLFLTLSLALLWWSWRHRAQRGGAWWQAALAGAFAGLLPYTYLAARITPFLYLLFGLSFLYPPRIVGAAKTRAGLERKDLLRLGLFAGVAALAAAPLLIYFALHPETLTIRSQQLSPFNEGQGNALAALLKNAWEHLLVFGFRGDRFDRYNFAAQPMLNPWQTLFFWLGVGFAVYRWPRSPANRLLLLWLVILILPAMLAGVNEQGANTLRMIGAAPAVYLLIGSGLWEAGSSIWSRRTSLQWRNRPFLPNYEAGMAAAAAAALTALILLQGVTTYRAFFQEWAAAPEFDRAYHAEWAEAAAALNAQQPAKDAVYLLPYPLQNEHFSDQHFGFEYLYQGAARALVLAALTPHDLAKKVETALSDQGSFSTVSFVDWNNRLVGGDARAEDHTLALLEKHGRYLGAEEYASFRIHTFKDVLLDRPWALYDRLQPVTVHFDKGISLHGFALGRSGGISSSHGEVDSRDTRLPWLALQWQTAPDLEVDFAIAVRLHNAEGSWAYQKDIVLSNSVQAPTSSWSPGELVDTFLYLDLPADFQPGEYELRLVVYDFETREPTVELGVWEPELALTRLRVTANRQ